jgi:hypothetical protein
MTTFDEREKAFEAKYKRDNELQFKVTARRNRLLGEWAAAKLGLTGQAAADYAKEVVSADFNRPGDDFRGRCPQGNGPPADARQRAAHQAGVGPLSLL